MPVGNERRIEERVSVLEIKVEHYSSVLEDNQEMLMKFFDRFDEHLRSQSSHTANLENTLIKVTTIVDNLAHEMARTNEALSSVAEKMDTTTEKVNEWGTIAKTLAKVVVSTTILVSGIWTVYAFSIDHFLK